MRNLFAPILVAALSAASVGDVAAEGTMYPKDPQAKMKQSIEEIFGVYILNPSRRHKDEKVVLKQTNSGLHVEMSLFYDQRRPDKNRIQCFAHRWLLLGRFGNGGARALFSRYPKIQSANLVFYTLKSKRTVDAKGKYTVTKVPQWLLHSRVSRRKAQRLDWAKLEKAMEIDGNRCARAGEKAVDRWRYSKYLGKKN